MWQLVLVSLLWGCTNPLMREGTKEQHDQETKKKDDETKNQGLLHQIKYQFIKLFHFFLNWRFSIPFVLNQSGSILYMYSLGSLNISVAVPLCTGLTSLFTTITAIFVLGEQSFDMKTFFALVLIITGTILCQLN